ncbi:hypothetical protein HYW75_05210 [Candidatus Pacearchaeota archaeon]|nr:hypothetical protein [Candidatus Pacearchaeota archaeon]
MNDRQIISEIQKLELVFELVRTEVGTKTDLLCGRRSLHNKVSRYQKNNEPPRLKSRDLKRHSFFG